jgi:hypothetical protein
LARDGSLKAGRLAGRADLDDGEPMPLTRGWSAQVRGSGVFPSPTGAEMILTFLAAARLTAAEKITPVVQPGCRRSHLRACFGAYA